MQLTHKGFHLVKWPLQDCFIGRRPKLTCRYRCWWILRRCIRFHHNTHAKWHCRLRKMVARGSMVTTCHLMHKRDMIHSHATNWWCFGPIWRIGMVFHFGFPIRVWVDFNGTKRHIEDHNYHQIKALWMECYAI